MYLYSRRDQKFLKNGMGDYDKVIKENIESIFLPLLEKFTGIRVVRSTQIKDKVQRTLEREPDFLKRVTDQHGNTFLLQLEFQTQNDPQMVYRMAEYKALLQRKYRLPVRQFVIYLGTRKPTMRTQLTAEEQISGFTLQNIHELNADELTTSEIPEEIILSILANPTQPVEKVIASIIARLQALARTEMELQRYIQQLIILSHRGSVDYVNWK
ncbi:MAG: hypothetical protein AAF944_23255 [Bacteroidota bacterium]